MVDLFATDALLTIDFNCHKQSEKTTFVKKQNYANEIMFVQKKRVNEMRR